VRLRNGALVFVFSTLAGVAVWVWWGGNGESGSKAGAQEGGARVHEGTGSREKTEFSQGAGMQGDGAGMRNGNGVGERREVAPRLVVLRDLEAACARISTMKNAEQVRVLLEQMAARLEALSPEEAVAVVREMLRGKQDAATGLGFTVGEGGWLRGAPSFRCWLLDRLSRIDSDAAATEAAQIVQERGSAEEWALALRDLARVRKGAEDGVFLRNKVRELVGDSRWRAEQSAGWLEAFDAVVHLRDVEMTGELASLAAVREGAGVPAAKAASLALDRLVQADPVEVLGRLLADGRLLEGREAMRASFFARADVRDPQQRAVLERYLLDPVRAVVERERFFGLYPNAHFALSQNLLTRTVGVGQDEQRARDRAALEVVGAWLKDVRFARMRSQLEQVRERLDGFVGEGGR